MPVYRRELSAEDGISLDFLGRYLGRYDWFFVQPTGLDFSWGKGTALKFPGDYFKSTSTYSRLLLSPAFYRAFERYEFVLIYQLDALAQRCSSGT